MTDIAQTSAPQSFIQQCTLYYRLTKPNVVFLMLVTSVIGMIMTDSDKLTVQLIVIANLGIALCAASAAVINHVADQAIDQIMLRTQNRPVAKGHVSLPKALIFSFILGVSGQWLLITQVNLLTALLTLGGLFGYAVIYTLVLKHKTPQNIVIGGLAGAIPPLLGWVAVTGNIHPNALLLVLIIFAWTPPHFWALAIARKDEYAKANIPMLPVTHGTKFTAQFIFLYTLIMVAVSLLPFVTTMSGYLYLASAIVLGAVFIFYSIRILQGDKKAPMRTFAYSIIYLFALFCMMLI
ncbi:MAG: heme o synthase, partial [Cellvibrionales bacterium]|nr:heme o synthase [Cellvibrionales bacterium]